MPTDMAAPAMPTDMAAPVLEPPLTKLGSVPRLVAIGDLHGDLDATRRALVLAGAIDASDRWIGGPLVVVQTGDVLDRGDDDRAVVELLERVRAQAKAQGGRLISLSGNHEVMNVLHDFRYVSAGANAAFGGDAGRRAAFAPGGEFARILAGWPVTAQVGDSVFVHGGVLEKHVRYGLGRIDREMAAFMRGEAERPPVIAVDSDSPIWTRLYSSDPGPDACAELGRVLAALGAARMVVGHTVQAQGINAACGGQVWRIDVGLSRAYGGVPQVLEVVGSTARALH